MLPNRSPLADFQIRGEWWLPENPAQRTSGVLYYKAGDWVKLDLDKPLRDPWIETEPGIQTLSPGATPTEVVLGDGLDGTLCTLLHGHQLLGEVISRHLLLGAHYQREADIQFRSAEFGLTHLEEWTEHSPFAIPITSLSQGDL